MKCRIRSLVFARFVYALRLRNLVSSFWIISSRQSGRGDLPASGHSAAFERVDRQGGHSFRIHVARISRQLLKSLCYQC